ncbi:MAG TPA: hypothetical protein VE974_06270 [Thermoanaerobaculia bacterium]|nr:hypothetical protein [Thermoanaerobaculia bacterium]
MALTGSPEPRPKTYGPTLTCPSPECRTRREFMRVPTESQVAPNHAWRSPFGWQAICGKCGEEFVTPPG